MNDTELDQLLDSWIIPTPSASLRQNTVSRFNQRRRNRKLLPKLLVPIAASILLLVIPMTHSFPQLLPPANFTIDSEVSTYPKDGPPAVIDEFTSFFDHGNEFRVSETIPGQPLRSALHEFGNEVGLLAFRIARPFLGEAERKQEQRFSDWVKRGCTQGNPVTADEPILDHPTVKWSSGGRGPAPYRITESWAPDLNCFPMKVLIEQRQPDGSWRLVEKREAVKINWLR